MIELDDRTISYIQEVSKSSILNFDRQKELGEIIQKNNDGKERDDAIKELVTHNLLLVVSEAFKFSRKTGMGIQDLIGAGNEGIMTAAVKYNPRVFNTRFSTYAIPWIKEAMQVYAYENLTSVRIPIHIINGVKKHKEILESGAPFNNKELMKELKVTEKGLRKIFAANVVSISLNQPVTFNKNGEEKDTTISDLIEDDKSQSPFKASEISDDYEILYSSLDELDEMSREIVLSQCLADDKVQLFKLGQKFNVSGERIRQIRDSALAKLRKKIERKTNHGK